MTMEFKPPAEGWPARSRPATASRSRSPDGAGEFAITAIRSAARRANAPAARATHGSGRRDDRALIRWSVANRFLVLLATVLRRRAWGVWAVRTTPLDAHARPVRRAGDHPHDAIPGQAPQIVENQVTYPLTTTMLSVPGAKTVRGYSFFGDSFVYVLFEDGTDLYWARSRVLEYLNQVQARLPRRRKPALGPDATGVGWIYEYALVDRSGQHDLGAAARAAGLVPASTS